MHPKTAVWLELLLNGMRVGRQVVCLTGPREHHDIRDARTHTKAFEVWCLSKTLGVYPDGYRVVPADEFEGLDGTLPDFKEEFSAKDVGLLLREWFRAHQDSRIVILHDGDSYWKEACNWANAESTPSMTIQELSVAFKLDTGAREDQEVEWPRRLRTFLDNLDDNQTFKLSDYLIGDSHG